MIKAQDDVILKVENLSKQYRLGLVGTGTLSHDLNRWWHRIRGKEDPYLKIGESNDRSQKGASEYVWALRDINFEVKRGEVLGIIGKNGAGKSTLLKILSNVASPTTGSVKTRGRIASLLEVGTGFHGEMTGRENIYLNGAILGMTKKEIKNKIEEIIAFSGCARYIDTPVKRYSSGMTVRLAFAVAAFLEPDILIIDEVLAVGDAEFQKKAIGKMQDISSGQGRTVLFVSHNMAMINQICSMSLLMENGFVTRYENTSSIIKYYLNQQIDSTGKRELSKNSNFSLKNVRVTSVNEGLFQNFGEKFELLVSFHIDQEQLSPCISYHILNSNGTSVLHEIFNDNYDKLFLERGDYDLYFSIENIKLYPDRYSIDIYVADNETRLRLDTFLNAYQFEVIGLDKTFFYGQPGSAIYKESNTTSHIKRKVINE